VRRRKSNYPIIAQLSVQLSLTVSSKREPEHKHSKSGAPSAGFATHSSLFRLIEEVIFSRVDVRLAQLLAKSGSANIHATHQSLANELGSAREVISRLLNEFQRRKLG
jgi:CRP-like cAMP-binding protein